MPHIRSGRVVQQETVSEGFDRLVPAFLGMLRGANTGKALVRLTDAEFPSSPSSLPSPSSS